MTSKPWCREGYRCLFGDRGGARRSSGSLPVRREVPIPTSYEIPDLHTDSNDGTESNQQQLDNIQRPQIDDVQSIVPDVQSLDIGGSGSSAFGVIGTDNVVTSQFPNFQDLTLSSLSTPQPNGTISNEIALVAPQLDDVQIVVLESGQSTLGSITSLSSCSSPQSLSAQSNGIASVTLAVGTTRPRVAFVGKPLPFVTSVTELGDVESSGCIDSSSLSGLAPLLVMGSALLLGMCLGKKFLGLCRRSIRSSSRKETVKPSAASLSLRPSSVATAPSTILVETVSEEAEEKTTADAQTLRDGLWMVPCVLIDGEWVVPNEDLAPLPLASPPQPCIPSPSPPPTSSPSIPESSPARQLRGKFGLGILPLLLMICIRIPNVLGNPVEDILSSSSPTAAAGLTAAAVGVAAIIGGTQSSQRKSKRKRKTVLKDSTNRAAASSSTKKSRAKSTSAAKLKVDESEADDEDEEEEEQSFSQPDAEFPESASGSEEVNAFLRGEEESKTFNHLKNEGHAMNWAAKYFGGNGTGTGYCAVAEVFGNAMAGFHVRVTKIMDEDRMGDSSSNQDETPVDARNRSRTKYKDERGNVVNHPKSYTCAPSDWDTNENYHPMNVRIWRAWLKLYKVISTLKTKSGRPIEHQHIVGPHLNWDLKPDEYFVVFMLRYCPRRLSRVLKGRHPAMAKNKIGECISATWDLVRISTPGAYEKGCKLNFWPFSFEYRGSPTDVYDKKNLGILMVAWVKFLRELFSLDVKIMLCSRGVQTDIEKHVFSQGRNDEERKSLFHNFWQANKSKFFSASEDFLYTPWHPECHLNPDIKARYTNGFEAICSLHDNAYTNVVQYVFGDTATLCRVGSDIFNEEAGTPGYKRRMEACAAALSRAQEAAKKYRLERDEMVNDINNATGAAKTSAVNKLIEAIRFKSATGVKRSKAVIGKILGRLVSKLGIEIVSDMSDELGVDPIMPKTLATGRKVGSGCTSVAAGTRKKDKKRGRGRTSVAAGTRKKPKTKAEGRKEGGGRFKSDDPRAESQLMMDKAFRLMQTNEYKAMNKGKAQLAALEKAGFRFDEEGTQMERKDQFGKTLHARNVSLGDRVRRATKTKG